MLRKQITRDIHDDVGSTLNYLKMTIKEALEEKSTDQEKLNRAVQLGNQAMDSLRNLIWKLDERAVPLEKFAAEIKDYTHQMLSSHQIPFLLDVVGFDSKKPLPPHLHHNFLMIYKEAIQNALKHGDNRNIVIELRQSEKAIFLWVKNGVAKKAAAVPSSRAGLKNMTERASLLNGEITYAATEDFFELQLKTPL